MSTIGAQGILSDNHTNEAWELIGRDMIRTCDGRRIVAQFWTSPSAHDARLIAAAPELLEIARHAREQAVHSLLMDAARINGFNEGWNAFCAKYGKPDHIAEMDAAIAKATGQS